MADPTTPTMTHEERKQAMAALRAAGWSNQQIGAHFGVSREIVRRILGEIPRPAGVTKQPRTLRAAPETWAGAEALARSLGLIVPQGGHTGSGSIIMLLDALARGDLAVRWKAGKGPGR